MSVNWAIICSDNNSKQILCQYFIWSTNELFLKFKYLHQKMFLFWKTFSWQKKNCILIHTSLKFVPKGSINVNTGSGYCLALNRCQAITWINMTTSSNGNIFRVTGPLCGNSPVTSEFPSQRPVMWSFDVFFDLRLNKCLSIQSGHRWFEMPLCSLWRHCNEWWSS